MNAQESMAPKIKKETKNKIKVEFERTPLKERLKAKFINTAFIGNVVWYLFRFILLVGIAYIVLFPFYSKIAGSFMSKEDFVDVTVMLIPKHFSLDIYKFILLENNYFQAFGNTLLLAGSTALIQTFICCLIAYGLAKFKFKGAKLIFGAVILTMVVPHQTLQLSLFMHFRFFDVFGILGFLSGNASVGNVEWLNNILASINIFGDGGTSKLLQGLVADGGINLNNTFWPLIVLSLTGLAFKNGLYIFLLRQFFRGVPDELEESAYIDGSGTFRTFIQIILPLSIPMMITVFLFAFSWQWTDDFYTKLFFTTTKTVLMPDVVAIPKSLETNYAGQNLYYPAIRNTCGLLIMLPLIIMYLFCQKFLVQGIERSGLTAD
ncbi:MAG: carbohydrate ABC transporter permease [Clostridia bacterium]|nr:carbohydrate ABC transporter permease [Clostridia bacterium]